MNARNSLIIAATCFGLVATFGIGGLLFVLAICAVLILRNINRTYREANEAFQRDRQWLLEKSSTSKGYRSRPATTSSASSAAVATPAEASTVSASDCSSTTSCDGGC